MRQESHQDANGKHEALAKKLDDKMRMLVEWSTHKKSFIWETAYI